MERKDALLSEAGEAGPRPMTVSVSCQTSLEDLLSLEGRDCPRALVTVRAGGDRTLGATAAADAQSKESKKAIVQKVRGSVKWYSVKHGYGFIRRHDTQEEVFVHHSAIFRSGPRKYKRGGMGTGETVVFDVLQGKRGSEAANVTRPDGGPVMNRRFMSGFSIHPGTPQPVCGARGAKQDVVDGKDGREGLAAAKGQKYCLTSNPHAQQQRRFPPFREAPGATCGPATIAPANGPRAVPLPAPEPPAESEDAPPRRGQGLSYRRSRPRGRGTTPDPKPSPDLTRELEAERKESRSDADRLQQGAPPRSGCHCPSNPCDRHGPQQPPDEQGQKPEGAEGEIGKGPAGKPACVAEKTSASKGKAAVAKASSAAQAQ